MIGRRWPAAGLLFLLALASPAIPGEGEDPLPGLCAGFAAFDLNSDGAVEIERLVPLPDDPACGESTAPLLLVLVEERLLAPLGGEKADDLTPSLVRYAEDLGRDGWRPRLVSARVYSGERHQDGRTLLALRRFLQKVREADTSLAGAVLVGSFPEAYLVRSYNWRKRVELTLNRGTPREKRFRDRVPVLRTVPEGVADRCELVLSDLDGNWERLYVEDRERLETVVGVYPDGVPPRGGICRDFERGGVVFEDFFFVNDGRLDVREVLGRGPVGSPTDEVVALDLEPLDEYENAECTAADRAAPNPLARPDVLVSRINARGVALRPRRDVPGLEGEGLLDEAGKPRTVTFAEGRTIPRWTELWERDPVLERRLLVEYFERNHRYRRGEFEDAFKPAAISHGLRHGFDMARRASPAWATFSEKGYLVGNHASILDVARWLGLPAAFRDFRAHSDPWGSVFLRSDVAALTEACGGVPWSWSRKGSSLVPSLESACGRGKVDFALLRTLWANGVLPDAGCIYLHGGCHGISPAGARSLPYDHPSYGRLQGAESLLFYANGLALMGRAKVFYDEPRGFHAALAAGNTVGEAWAEYFRIESEARSLGEVGGGIGRKRSYFWSVLGDWTLRLR